MITSASNEKIKEIKKLLKSAGRRREKKTYIVEGVRMIREVPAECVKALYVSESMEETFHELCKQFHGIVEVVKDSVFNSMSDTNTPQGILAEVWMQDIPEERLFQSNEIPFLLLIEHLQDPGNLGTIIRTAEGAGVTGIIVSPDTVDIYNPKVIRSTMGSVFRMPVFVSKDLKETIGRIKNRGITVYGAHLDGMDFYEKDFTGGCAFLIGNEGNGLSPEISMQADELICIPMKGQVESLNAAISTAVISYEVLRQRTLIKK